MCAVDICSVIAVVSACTEAASPGYDELDLAASCKILSDSFIFIVGLYIYISLILISNLLQDG
jgi:hypothetical protein